MKYQVYLASNSFSRKLLLEASKIPFLTISQSADESQCSLRQPLQDLVTQLAQLKMQHVILPVGVQDQVGFFLTADTMTMDLEHNLYGKAIDRDDAKRMLRACRKGAVIGTAFCLERKVFKNNTWTTQERIIDYDQAWCLVDVPEAFLDFYLDRVPYMDVSGGITIEGFGEQFVKEVRGCYSAILGLPMYKVREALCALGFY